MENNEDFYIGQVFLTDYPMEAAIWCNEHHAYIEPIVNEDGTTSYKIVESKIEEIPDEVILTRKEVEFGMSRWQREGILADGSQYSDYTKQKAQELEDLAKKLRKEQVVYGRKNNK